jgi:hypothetical protein
MAMKPEWTKEAYLRSLSSCCWSCTEYDTEGSWPNVEKDGKLREIYETELSLGRLPKWAGSLVRGPIGMLPMCGHYKFPLPFLDAVDSVGQQKPVPFMHGCFTVERERKRHMMDYLLCLDCWLAGTTPDVPARELTAMASRSADWQKICRDLWRILGKRTELKELLVERLLHLRRHQLKERVWDDDLASEFGRDQYLGNYRSQHNPAQEYCCIRMALHSFDQKASPRVQKNERRLAEIFPEWNDQHDSFKIWMISETWLCAPKEFRFMERMIWAIGKERNFRKGDRIPGFLQCADILPDRQKAATYWRAFLRALDSWWRGQTLKGKVALDINRRLGKPTPVKRWLVRLLAHKCRVLAADNRMVQNT